eukprot:475528-Amphidinium_carterae.1
MDSVRGSEWTCLPDWLCCIQIHTRQCLLSHKETLQGNTPQQETMENTLHNNKPGFFQTDSISQPLAMIILPNDHRQVNVSHSFHEESADDQSVQSADI